MAISTGSAINARRRARSFGQAFLKPSLNRLLKTFFEIHGQLNLNVDLQVIENVDNSTTDIVIADAPCKLYAIFFKGGSSGGDYRQADHAASANSPTTTIPIGASEHTLYTVPAGRSFANGITVDASGANSWTSLHIIGAP